jgi:hypothetical protein
LIKDLDRHLRYLMSTALLVHNEWDVDMETLPRQFEQSFHDEPMNRASREFWGLLQQAEGLNGNEGRELALEAVWQFECFLRHLRRYTR